MVSTATATEVAVIVLGFCLLGIIGALILNPKFRSDLSANPGKLSFYGASVEGVVIVLIIGALIISIVVCTQILADLQTKKIEAGKDEKFIRLNDLPSEVSKKTAEASIAEIKSMVEKAKHPVGKFNLVEAVSKLNYSSSESEKIREFPAKRLGPWSISGETKSYMLSVPGNISEGEAYWCQINVNRYYEISSNNNEYNSHRGQTIKITHPITMARTCPETQKFLQVPCSIAQKVFGTDAVTCDSSGKPKWHMDLKGPLPIKITEVSPP